MNHRLGTLAHLIFGIDKLDQSALARRHAVLSAGELLVTGTAASERSSTDAQRGLSLFKLGNLCSHHS